jgi:hypothetical protein
MRFVSFMVTFLGFSFGTSFGYSVLSHEAVVDAVWSTDLTPALLAKFPNATPEELKEALAYAYGGCLIQDLGYAPFASHTFSNLVHYVRSGDFVTALIHQATDLNELAFAYGALAHYASDRTGHLGINRITPLAYPRLEREYGPVVTYEDDEARHLKTEFALDVIQVARGSYAPAHYHDFIGFEIAKSALERAFEETYGFPLKDLLVSEDLAFGTYRFAASQLIPEMTRVAWISKRKDIENLTPGITQANFVYSMSSGQYVKEWGTKYRRPGFFTRVLALVLRMIPGFGPFKALRFQPVSPEGEQIFVRSFEASVGDYRKLIAQMRTGAESLPEVNLDTGAPVRPGEYKLADETYVTLLAKLAEKHFQSVSPALRADILAHFNAAGAVAPARTEGQLREMRSIQ